MPIWCCLDHTGALTFRRWAPGPDPHVRHDWPVDRPDQQARCIVEATMWGAQPGAVRNMRHQWGMTDDRLVEIANMEGFRMWPDGTCWAARLADMPDLVCYDDNPLDALVQLRRFGQDYRRWARAQVGRLPDPVAAASGDDWADLPV